MLAKKEYGLIAGVLKDLPDQPSKNGVITQFVNRLDLDNPRFNKDEFIKACGVGLDEDANNNS